VYKTLLLSVTHEYLRVRDRGIKCKRCTLYVMGFVYRYAFKISSVFSALWKCIYLKQNIRKATLCMFVSAAVRYTFQERCTTDFPEKVDNFPEFPEFPGFPEFLEFPGFPEFLEFPGFPRDFGGKIPGFFPGFKL